MEFYTAVEEARSEWETRQLEGIEEAGKSGPLYWTARAWLLERRMPEKYALKARVEYKHELRIAVGQGPEEIEGPEEIGGGGPGRCTVAQGVVGQQRKRFRSPTEGRQGLRPARR